MIVHVPAPHSSPRKALALPEPRTSTERFLRAVKDEVLADRILTFVPLEDLFRAIGERLALHGLIRVDDRDFRISAFLAQELQSEFTFLSPSATWPFTPEEVQSFLFPSIL
jgi:hypothetical protein